MRVNLAYEKNGLTLDVPDNAAILAALRNLINFPPLREKVKPGDTVAIAHTDINRATPNALILS